MKHTPGPWVLDEARDGVAITTESRMSHNQVEIALVELDWEPPFEQEQQANANLIVTAPEMYALLRYWRDECSGAEPSLSVFNRSVDDLLAKVEGMAQETPIEATKE